MQIREDIRNAYVINDKGISRNVVARSSFCAAAKLIQPQFKIGMIFQPIRLQIAVLTFILINSSDSAFILFRTCGTTPSNTWVPTSIRPNLKNY